MVVAQDRGWQTVGLEVSSTAAAVARDTTQSNIHVGTLEECNFAPEIFDAVTSWEVLEHVVNPVAFAQNIRTILKTGGLWALSTPNWRSGWERAATASTRRPPYHVTFWSPDSLRRLLLQTGFSDIVIKEKPIAWQEEVGKRKKWVYLPVAVFRSLVLNQKGNRLFALARKPRD